MASTWKDKQKSDRPKELKNQHKAHRQSVQVLKNYVPTEEEEVVFAFSSTQEEQQAWDEYQASLGPQEDFS